MQASAGSSAEGCPRTSCPPGGRGCKEWLICRWPRPSSFGPGWRVADGKGQAEPQGLQDLQLLDDLLTVDQRTRNVRLGECQEDGWQGGQGDEGGGAV